MSGKTIAGPVTMSSSEYNTLTIQRTTTGGNAIIVLIDGNQNAYRFGIETGEGPDANHRLYIQKYQNAGTPIESPTKQFIEYDGDIPSFYKSYQSLASLISGIFNSKDFQIIDANNVTQAGIYTVPATAANLPVNAQLTIVCITIGGGGIIHIAFRMINNEIYTRTRKGSSDAWSQWRTILIS